MNVVMNDKRLLRGGSWNYYPWFCRSASRVSHQPGGVDSHSHVGLRVVCLPQGCSSTAARKPGG